MSQTLETDYLVIGAGGMGMAFADEILTHTDATLTIVDRQHRPGGHWNDAYPFVRLHQTSTCYGVNSTEMGGYRVDEVGLNKGCYELASGSEVVAYFDNVMRRRFLPSGRVNYLPSSEYAGDGQIRRLISGELVTVRARKTVDAGYLKVTVPAQRPPGFAVETGAHVVAVNELPRVAAGYARFVIVGSGKTGMDACLFLLTNGVAPERITWIMPADAWMFDRFCVNPGRRFSDPITQYAIGILQCALAAADYEDFFAHLVQRELIMQLDPAVQPTRWRCATFTPLELEQLRRIRNVVRLGYLESAGTDRMQLQHGKVPTPPGAVFIDCAADGLPRVPPVPVFDGDRITLQTVRMCQQVYSGGFIGNVEANVHADEARKNALTEPVPLPYTDVDYLRCALQNSRNMLVWLTEPAVVSWINASRIDLFSPLLDFDDPETAGNIRAMGDLIGAAVPKMESLLAGAPDRGC
ncbi:MAG: NAD(P)/FAD-dependent oxidoreductase [Gammaproteobacteria bacterium]